MVGESPLLVQTAPQAAGRMELLSRPLHYVNSLMTQITMLHADRPSHP